MAVSISTLRREKIKRGIRKKITGSAERPRLCVFRSNKEIYAQVVDDVSGKTITGRASTSKDLASGGGTKTEKSRRLGMAIAKVAKEKGIESVVFDRNGFQYHGRVKALAEGAREGGLKF